MRNKIFLWAVFALWATESIPAEDKGIVDDPLFLEILKLTPGRPFDITNEKEYRNFQHSIHFQLDRVPALRHKIIKKLPEWAASKDIKAQILAHTLAKDQAVSQFLPKEVLDELKKSARANSENPKALSAARGAALAFRYAADDTHELDKLLFIAANENEDPETRNLAILFLSKQNVKGIDDILIKEVEGDKRGFASASALEQLRRLAGFLSHDSEKIPAVISDKARRFLEAKRAPLAKELSKTRLVNADMETLRTYVRTGSDPKLLNHVIENGTDEMVELAADTLRLHHPEVFADQLTKTLDDYKSVHLLRALNKNAGDSYLTELKTKRPALLRQVKEGLAKSNLRDPEYVTFLANMKRPEDVDLLASVAIDQKLGRKSAEAALVGLEKSFPAAAEKAYSDALAKDFFPTVDFLESRLSARKDSLAQLLALLKSFNKSPRSGVRYGEFIERVLNEQGSLFGPEHWQEIAKLVQNPNHPEAVESLIERLSALGKNSLKFKPGLEKDIRNAFAKIPTEGVPFVVRQLLLNALGLYDPKTQFAEVKNFVENAPLANNLFAQSSLLGRLPSLGYSEDQTKALFKTWWTDRVNDPAEKIPNSDAILSYERVRGLLPEPLSTDIEKYAVSKEREKYRERGLDKKDPCEMACTMVEKSKTWFDPKFIESPEFKEDKTSWKFAMLAMTAQAMTKAAPFCESAKAQVQSMVDSLAKTKKNEPIEASLLSVDDLMKSARASTGGAPPDASSVYAKIFHSGFLDDLDAAGFQYPGLGDDLRKTQNDLLADLEVADKFITGTSGSLFNNYLLSAANATAPRMSAKMYQKMLTIYQRINGPTAKNPCGLSYDMNSYSGGDPSDAAGRAVIFYLALARNEPEPSRRDAWEDHMEQCLVIAEETNPMTARHVDRDSTHANYTPQIKSERAPYYFMMRAPYGFAAVSYLLKKAKPAKRAFLKQLSKDMTTTVSSIVKKLGTVIPAGAQTYPSSALYNNAFGIWTFASACAIQKETKGYQPLPRLRGETDYAQGASWNSRLRKEHE